MVRFLSALFLSALLFVAPAAANSHHGGRSATGSSNVTPGGGGGGAADLTFTIRGTQIEQVDLAAMLAAVPEAEDITVTANNSNVAPYVWLHPTCGIDGHCKLKKFELLDTLTAQTFGVADGTASTIWTLTSTTLGTKTVQANVSSPEITTWDYGANSQIRWAGFPESYLAGGATDWQPSSVAASCPNPAGGTAACNTLWESFGQHLVVKCVGSLTLCPADGTATAYFTGSPTAAITVANRTGSTTASVCSATLGGTCKTITINWIPNQWDVGPTPSFMTNNTTNSQFCGPGAYQFGDAVKAEGTAEHPVVYGATSGTSMRCFLPTATARGGGPSAPTEAAGYGNGTNDAGWVRWSPREPWGATIGGSGTITPEMMSNSITGTFKPTYNRFTQFINAPQFNDLSGSPYLSMIQVDHTRLGGLNIGKNGLASRNHFVTDNYVTSEVDVYGCDIQVRGNRFEKLNSDNIHHAIFQCTPGGSRAIIADNFQVGAFVRQNTQHIDGSQGIWNNAPSTTDLQTGDNDGPRSWNNVMVPGPPHLVDCSDVYVTGVPGTFSGAGCSGTQLSGAWAGPSDIGVNYEASQQCFLEGDLGWPAQYVTHVQVSNLCVTEYGQGISSSAAAVGSVVRYNTSSNVHISLGGGVYKQSGLGSPQININAPGAIETMEGNIGAAVVGATSLSGITAPAVNGFGNISNGSSTPTTYWTDAAHTGSTAAEDLWEEQTWLDMYAPKAAATIGGRTYGAVGNGKTDIRLRKVLDSTVFDPDPAVPTTPPRCTNAGSYTTVAATGTGKVAGDQIGIGVAATWTNSPGAVTHHWQRASTTGATTTTSNPGNGTATYTIQPGDLSSGTTVTIYDIAEVNNSSGSGGCVSTAFQIKP